MSTVVGSVTLVVAVLDAILFDIAMLGGPLAPNNSLLIVSFLLGFCGVMWLIVAALVSASEPRVVTTQRKRFVASDNMMIHVCLVLAVLLGSTLLVLTVIQLVHYLGINLWHAVPLGRDAHCRYALERYNRERHAWIRQCTDVARWKETKRINAILPTGWLTIFLVVIGALTLRFGNPASRGRGKTSKTGRSIFTR